ncbi:DUF3866 family protein [Janibacter limosus]|uniref:DUF3866 family protein n=1 Tax=Janibacter limosus TaxID=53458 RepID=A0A4P6MR19_9MICO|nr:DUF3866 family protein [Janibacter limosus]QBF46061.1 DUF3866 family protein [Janibacter limosus]
MIHWRSGTVREITGSRPGALRLRVEVEGSDTPALALTGLVGSPQVGDTVLLNISALRRRLGTGGHALVVGNPSQLPADPPDSPGHIVKARYTPLQEMVLALEEQESPHHEAMRDHPDIAAGDLHGMPVVVAELHSSLPAVLAGIRSIAPGARVAYVMTDSAALPFALSDSAAQLVAAGWLATTITAGQAFGGEHEAITVHSALLAARHVLGCDLAVVAQGPGNAGSSTTWGWSGLSTGDALNAVHVLRGHGVAVPRVSGSDPRPRHHGLSHHTATVLSRTLLGAADVVVPDGDVEPWPRVRDEVAAAVASAAGFPRLVTLPAVGLTEALSSSPVPLVSMGRAAAEDMTPFLTAALAGRHAASLLT